MNRRGSDSKAGRQSSDGRSSAEVATPVWVPDAVDPAGLREQPLSSFVPLTYNALGPIAESPSPQLTPSGSGLPRQPSGAKEGRLSGRISSALRKMSNRLGRSSSSDIEPSNLHARQLSGSVWQVPGEGPPEPGWLNAHGIVAAARPQENEYGVALPREVLQGSSTARFPQPELNAPLPPPAAAGGTTGLFADRDLGGRAQRHTDSNRPLASDTNSQLLTGLSGFSIAQTSTSIAGEGSTAGQAGRTTRSAPAGAPAADIGISGESSASGAATQPNMRSTSVCLVHPMHRRLAEATHGAGSMHSQATEEATSVEQGSMGALSVPDISSASVTSPGMTAASFQTAGVTSTTAAGLTSGTLAASGDAGGRGLHQSRTSRSWAPANPDTILEETTEEAAGGADASSTSHHIGATQAQAAPAGAGLAQAFAPRSGAAGSANVPAATNGKQSPRTDGMHVPEDTLPIISQLEALTAARIAELLAQQQAAAGERGEAARQNAPAQALAALQARGTPQRLLGQYWCATHPPAGAG